MELRGKDIFVGLSGGVDSAVAAALLGRAGAQVTGVFIKGWYPPGMPCTWALERRDAMRVAARLRIPFETLDASVEYKRGVIDYLLAEYKAGRTPNPDVMCNREVKFGAFYRYAMERGADYIATGHYAQVALKGGGEKTVWPRHGFAVRGDPRTFSQATPKATLTRGRDVAKDQSYFLWAVPQEVLARTLFPLGDMAKAQVRAQAKLFGLPVYEKPDSQGVCFLGSVSVKDFLRAELGDNLAILRTIGERVQGGYVVGKDLASGSIEVASSPRGIRAVRFDHESFFGERSGPLTAEYRYHGPRVRGHLEEGVFIADGLLSEMPAPGQSLVFYRGDELVGGGIIVG